MKDLHWTRRRDAPIEAAVDFPARVLDGSGLRRIVPEPFWILTHSPTGDGRGIVVLALEPPKGKASVPREQMRQWVKV